MNKRTIWILAICILALYPLLSVGQSAMPSIREMKWGRDYNLHVKLSTDSNYVMDVRGLYHTSDLVLDTASQSTTYYPVSFDEEFISYIKNRKLEPEEVVAGDTAKAVPAKTLWSALHGNLGGGYVHFINCLVYSLESGMLNLTDPIMKRPVTDWKPKPMTDTYKRTRKWEYYMPYDQKLAQKEYKKRVKENDLRDLQGIPERFIQDFLITKQKEYELLASTGKRHQVAKIDLVRLLLGAKYLGADQISFIQNKVTSAVGMYGLNNLPTVIIFDDYNAAVAMVLDKVGYKIDYVVFRDQESISAEEQNLRIEQIEALIDAINEANERVFKKRLSSYYGG